MKNNNDDNIAQDQDQGFDRQKEADNLELLFAKDEEEANTIDKTNTENQRKKRHNTP